MKRLFVFFILILLFSLPAFAEEAGDDFYKEQYDLSGAEELPYSLPDQTREFFSRNGIDPSDYNWVNRLGGTNVFKHIWEFLRSGARRPFQAGAGILGVILITAALSAASEKNNVMTAGMYACTLAVAAVIALPVYSSITAGTGAMKGLSTFMLSFVPVFAVIVASSGGAVTSVSMSSLLLTAAEGVAYLSAFVVLPLMGGYLALSISTSVSPLVQRSGVADGIKKLSLWVLSFISTVFVGILGIQTAVNASADRLSLKTAKFILGSAVPVAGTALSEAVSTVTASLGLLKSSVGIYGVAAVACILLPIILELFLWRLAVMLTGSAAELFSLPKISMLLKAVDTMLSLMLGVLLLTAAIFIISITVVISAGRS